MRKPIESNTRHPLDNSLVVPDKERLDEGRELGKGGGCLARLGNTGYQGAAGAILFFVVMDADIAILFLLLSVQELSL